MTSIHSVGIVIPAHNEAALIAGALDAVRRAGGQASLAGVDIRLLVVLDRCTDLTGDIVRARGVETLSVAYGNVGASRAAGFDRLAAVGADCWFSSTDADTQVAPGWLAEQIRLAELGADAVFGVVDVDDWSAHPSEIRDRFHLAYSGTRVEDAAGHPHVHGASMGIRASAYRAIGGFAALAVGEDQALSDRLDREPGLTVVRSTHVRATTSARTEARAPRGFSSYLLNLRDGSALVPVS